MPERYKRYEKEPWYSRGLRMVAVDNYIIFYLTDIEHKTVYIIRVMYKKRNTAKQLDKI